MFIFLIACGILDPPPRIKPTPPALEGLAPGPSGKSLSCSFLLSPPFSPGEENRNWRETGWGGGCWAAWVVGGGWGGSARFSAHTSRTGRSSPLNQTQEVNPPACLPVESFGHQGVPRQRKAQGLRSHRLDLHLELASVVWAKILHLHSLKKPCEAHGTGVSSTDPGAQLPDLASWLCHSCCASY